MNLTTSNETPFDNIGSNPLPYYMQEETPKEESQRCIHCSDGATLLALNTILKSNNLVWPGTPHNAALEYTSTEKRLVP